jgi:tryptophan-rich sensory protein
MLVAFLAIAASVAAFGAVAAGGQVDGWYARAPHVTWTPPDWAFGLIWTVLYVLIAVSGWVVWRRRDLQELGAPLALYVAQFVVNALWAPVFFGGFPLIGNAALWIGVAIIVALDLLVVATMTAFWHISRTASLLLLPYLLWILYASTLNWGDAVLLTLT